VDQNIENQLEDLKILYSDIINGYSYYEEEDLYIAHLSDNQYNDIIKRKSSYLKNYIKEGIPTFEQRFKEIRDIDIWTLKDEDDILSYKYQISDNEKNLKNIIPQQRGFIEEQIKKAKIKLSEKLKERDNLIGRTSNDFAEKEAEYYFLFISLYKDKELNEKFFKNYEEFKLYDDEKISFYTNLLNEKLRMFNEKNILRICAMPFFLNLFSYSKDHIHTFLEKPISQLTQYQLLMISLGTRNLNILANCHAEPPQIFEVDNLDKIVEFYDSQYSILNSKAQTGEAGITKSSRTVVNSHR
jgi:hypothetical protein